MGSSFRNLYQIHYKRVFSTCLLILKNYSLAEEATQEAFIKAYEKFNTLRDESKFGAWVSSIASNCCMDIYNKSNKSMQFVKEDVIEFLINTSALNAYDPKDIIINNEQIKEIRNAISKLKPPQNQMIILRYYWQLSDQEISETLHIPIGTVKSSLYKARRSLAQTLKFINKDQSIRKGVVR